MENPDTIQAMQKLDGLIKEIRQTNTVLRSMAPGSTASVKIGGSGFVTGALIGICIATCIATWVALVLGAMELHDLRAWRDIDHAKITKLEAR